MQQKIHGLRGHKGLAVEVRRPGVVIARNWRCKWDCLGSCRHKEQASDKPTLDVPARQA
jgi:hypothetical protein